MQGFFYLSKHVIIEWIWDWTIPGMWEKFKFQLPDCLIDRCHRIWTCVIGSKRTCLDSKALHLLRIMGFSLLTTKKNRSQLAVLQQCNLKALLPSLKKICEQA